MRGTLTHNRLVNVITGIIPAYAGNTAVVTKRIVKIEDHPRVCGEHRAQRVAADPERGSSPRMRGTLEVLQRIFHGDGIIPAYAGNTCRIRSPPRSRWDHPRVCGEHLVDGSETGEWAGSSPRMRGTLPRAGLRQWQLGIIPAYAGNTGVMTPSYSPIRDHPRVCGEHKIRRQIHTIRRGSSPRMRGTLIECGRACFRVRIIPAYAGNTHWVR